MMRDRPDPFSDPQAVARYAEGAPRNVPGYDAMQRMTTLLLAERVPDDGRVLVLGAGGGLELKVFAEAQPHWAFDGVDPSAEMLKLAEHIVETKEANFDPSEFEDHYETAVVELLKEKQAGKTVNKVAPRMAPKQTGNVIDLLKRSLEIEQKASRKSKAPSLVPDLPKSKKKQKAS